MEMVEETKMIMADQKQTSMVVFMAKQDQTKLIMMMTLQQMK